MNDVLRKLKYNGQSPVLILDAPKEYEEYMRDIKSNIDTEIKGKYKFIQVFETSLTSLKKAVPYLIDALDGDGYLWICYPKGTSKKYKSDINRDKIRDTVSPYNFETVTLVAIDNDWSAMRVRNVDFIKTMKRKTALSEKGKEKIGKNE